jgi:hypothetical protein
VSAIIHHGGAGTTAAGLRAGKPTFICPFFGDQHFWAEMIFRAGAGPRGCPIANLTVEILSQAFQLLKSPETQANVSQLSARMNEENGVAKGIDSFLANLPVEDMLCEVSLFRKRGVLASVYCETCSLRMSREVDVCIHRKDGNRSQHTRVEYRYPSPPFLPPCSFPPHCSPPEGRNGASLRPASSMRSPALWPTPSAPPLRGT